MAIRFFSVPFRNTYSLAFGNCRDCGIAEDYKGGSEIAGA
jgi:hypothetical protein